MQEYQAMLSCLLLHRPNFKGPNLVCLDFIKPFSDSLAHLLRTASDSVINFAAYYLEVRQFLQDLPMLDLHLTFIHLLRHLILECPLKCLRLKYSIGVILDLFFQ